MENILKWIAGLGAILLCLLTVVTVGGFLVLTYMDFSQYREAAEKKISRELGRKTKINGDFDIKFSLHPEVKLSNVVIENAEWSATQNAVVIGEFYLRLSPWSLLGRPVLDEIILKDTQIRLETKDGQSNLGKRNAKSASGSNYPGKPNKGHKSSVKDFWENIPLVRRADIANIDLYMINHDKDLRRHIRIASVRSKEASKHAEISVNIADIISNDESLGNLTAEVRLTEESLVVRSLRQGNTVSGTLEYHPESKIRTDINLSGFRLEAVSALMGSDYNIGGTMDGKITLRGAGESHKDMLRKLSGNIKLDGRDITVTQDFRLLNFLQSLNIPTPAVSGCVLLDAPMKDGVIALDNAVAVTNIGNAQADGYIDLAQENLDIIAELDISLPAISYEGHIKIKGDLYDPDYDISEFKTRIDPKRLLEDSGGLLEELGNLLTGNNANLSTPKQSTNCAAASR